MTADRARDGYLRVLVAYDGSERAEDALALALRLRAPSGGALTLASVRAHHRPWAGTERTAPADEPDAVADAVEAMLGEARHRVPPGVPVRVREVLAASATRGLSELVEAVEADLAVVGSSSHAAPAASPSSAPRAACSPVRPARSPSRRPGRATRGRSGTSASPSTTRRRRTRPSRPRTASRGATARR